MPLLDADDLGITDHEAWNATAHGPATAQNTPLLQNEQTVIVGAEEPVDPLRLVPRADPIVYAWWSPLLSPVEAEHARRAAAIREQRWLHWRILRAPLVAATRRPWSPLPEPYALVVAS